MRKTCVRLSSKSRTQLKPSSVPFGMRDIFPAKSPNPFHLLASEVDSAASANVFDSDADIAKKAALLDHKTVVNCKSVLSRLLAGRGHPYTPGALLHDEARL